MKTNIIFAGVGGQGLVLTSRIVVEATHNAGLPVSGSDVYGLAQRGGSVWGMVRINNEFFSPQVPKGEADILMALEQLEGLRWLEHMKPGGLAIVNNNRVHPTPVLLEQEEYPQDVIGTMKGRDLQVIPVDGPGVARKLGNIRLANTVLLGTLSRHLPMSPRHWLEAIAAHVPPKTVELNQKAFELGRE